MKEFKLKRTLIAGLGAIAGSAGVVSAQAATTSVITPEWNDDLHSAMARFQETQLKVIALKQDLTNDPDLLSDWKADPLPILRAREFSPDAQLEILREEHRIDGESFASCACTGCCVTSINA